MIASSTTLAQLEAEKERSDALLRNILPEPIVGRLNDGEVVIADRFENVTILFCDLVGFTKFAARMAPQPTCRTISTDLFSAFDALAARLGIEKIKTIGDAYMAAAGLPEADPTMPRPWRSWLCGMLEALQQLNKDRQDPLPAPGSVCIPVRSWLVSSARTSSSMTSGATR